MYIIIAIIAFGILIAIHEFGHFSAAKLLGVKVNEFSIGMGPAIISHDKGETKYSLRILPIGGYCAMEGEDENTGDPRAFTAQAVWKRLIILVAGSFMNFLLGVVLVCVVLWSSTAFVSTTIDSFFEDCPYEGEDALMVGDTFKSIDGHAILVNSDFSTYLSRGDGIYDIVLIRDGERVELKDFEFVPVEYQTEDGIETKYGIYFAIDEADFGTKVSNSIKTSWNFVRMVWMGLSDLVRGAVGINDLSGPVGVVSLINEVGQESENVADAIYNIMYLCAFIAINLSVMNMLPIPALDGGRVFLLLVTAAIERISRRKIDPKYEGYIHAVGMVILLALMAFVMFNDVLKIFK